MLAGVYETTKKNGSTYYRAGLTYRSKHISLGSSDIAFCAHAMYAEGQKILSDPAITIDNFAEYIKELSFEKAIALLNFRDNGLYIRNPIYLQKGFFLYYLSLDLILKFDYDDLFYYSSHKIIRRGGHLFVNDYGMQYNIANRYGVKSYAVVNRDFKFANGDATDYRYANIIILNRYHGITQTTVKGVTKYIAKIHLNGNITIGRYSSEAKAAVAYNKAVDYARSCGHTKEFIQNYITELSPKEYAEIYTAISLSERCKRSIRFL